MGAPGHKHKKRKKVDLEVGIEYWDPYASKWDPDARLVIGLKSNKLQLEKTGKGVRCGFHFPYIFHFFHDFKSGAVYK